MWLRLCVSVVQKHCCLSSVKESQCESGMSSARGGDTCDVDEEDRCSDDSYQVRHRLTSTRTRTTVLFFKSEGICCRDALLDCMQWRVTGKRVGRWLKHMTWGMDDAHTRTFSTNLPLKQTLNWLQLLHLALEKIMSSLCDSSWVWLTVCAVQIDKKCKASAVVFILVFKLVKCLLECICVLAGVRFRYLCQHRGFPKGETAYLCRLANRFNY